MPVLVTINFDDGSIKNVGASMETAFSHHKSMGNSLDAFVCFVLFVLRLNVPVNNFSVMSGWIFRCKRAANSIVSGPIWPKFKLV